MRSSIFVAVCLAGLCGLVAAAEPAPHAWLTEHPVIQEMHQRHNAERARWGLYPLQLDPELCLQAQRHATYMADTGWYAHSGYGPENIHTGPRSAADAVNAWIWSPAHHRNMLYGGSRAGYGYQYKNGHLMWVSQFR